MAHMLHDHDEKGHAAPITATAPRSTAHLDASQDPHALAASCRGNAEKLSAILAKLPAVQQQRVLVEAQKLYGNQFVQTVMKDIGSGYTPIDLTKGPRSRETDPSKRW